jgi:hypothetical protein
VPTVTDEKPPENAIMEDLSHWNHRVVKKTHTLFDGSKEDTYGIHEVYYDKDGKPTSLTVNPVEPHGSTLDELRQDLEWMTAALAKPVLDFDDF